MDFYFFCFFFSFIHICFGGIPHNVFLAIWNKCARKRKHHKYTDSGYGTGKGSKGSTSSNSQNRIMSSDSALFTTRNNTKVIAQRGGLAVLPCAVKWNPTATVSFNRTINKYTQIYPVLVFQFGSLSLARTCVYLSILVCLCMVFARSIWYGIINHT